MGGGDLVKAAGREAGRIGNFWEADDPSLFYGKLAMGRKM
jgi:hypothetical protein